jgi:hypothetical protein
MTKVEQYTKDFQEFLEQFQEEDDCRNYIFNLRWSEGYYCPKCNSNQYWMTKQQLIHYSSCGYQLSIAGGTIFPGTRKPVLFWFHIMWWGAAQKTGARAYDLMDLMGFGSYKTARAWFLKLRRAMVRPGRDKLTGLVEMVKDISGSGQMAHELSPIIYMVDSLVKRRLYGTRQGKVSPKHLPHCLHGFAFRFNRKLSTCRGKFFYGLIPHPVDTQPCAI